MAKVLVKDGKGNIFEIEESLLEGDNCIVTEEEIKSSPRIDVEKLRSQGYVTVDELVERIENGTFVNTIYMSPSPKKSQSKSK